MFFYVLVLFLCKEYVYASSDGPEWGYGESHDGVLGIEEWGKLSETCKTGKRQSPVDIVTSEAETIKSDSTEKLVTYDKRYGMLKGDLFNNGHAPTFKVTDGNVFYKNPLNNADYKLAQFHFHFGCNDSVGSEHTIDGKSYPGEVHLVFFKTNYGEFENAFNKTDGLTVIGVFLKKTSSFRASKELRKLAEMMNEITKHEKEPKPLKDVVVKLVPLCLKLRRPEFRAHYSYNGSLTTPGCHETVDWRVLKRPINVDNFVLKQLRKLQSNNSESGKMCDNFRPTQPLNGRDIKLVNYV